MTDVKTARDVLDACKMSAAYNDARPHEESGLLIAALAEAGYEITPVRADDRVRDPKWIEALVSAWMDCRHIGLEPGDPAFEEARANMVDALAAADAVAGAGRDADALPRYRHKKRGTEYVVIGEAGLQTEQPLVDGDRLVVYRGLSGDLWARPPHEFHDGRFDEIDAALAPAAGEVRT